MSGQPEINRVDDADGRRTDYQGGEENIFRATGPLQQHERQTEKERLLMDRLQQQLEHALGQAIKTGADHLVLPDPFGEQ